MPAEARSPEEIRAEIASERVQLEDALADLRKGVDAKRRPALAVAALLAAALAAVLLARITRRFRSS